MNRVLVLIALLACLIGCSLPKPPDLTTPVTYVGIWRMGTSKDNYRIFRIYQDKSVSLFGTKRDIAAPADLNGDELLLKGDKATTKGTGYAVDPNYPAERYPFHLHRVSEKKIEITDTSGLFFGSNSPVPFEQITEDMLDETNSQIMQRAMNGG